MDLLLRLGPLDVRVSEIGFVLDYGERVGQSKMKVLKTIRSTIALLSQRRVERMMKYRRGQVAALEAAGRARQAAATGAVAAR